MDREKQGKEVLEYVESVVLVSATNYYLLEKIIKAIMRRYDLVPRGE